eukprot:CAMPEP_0119340748 /NCGR_PEP_ID=MMETSP1333-20130426/100964_1 /TAXON_ID=418940 /ORGANISM="Scyphosphaera apsteinii, Strain RCC1455" /LENGTH=419 /DNA_ID=CAMNT_0007352563 /DNA_START=20 /DNA_END=1279 /DNA_ORIENTATION=-
MQRGARSDSNLATVQAVTQAVAQAIRDQNGKQFAHALRLDLGNLTLLTQLSSGRLNLQTICGAALEEPYDEMLLEHFEFLRATHRGEALEAYSHCERACSCFQAVFEKDTSWSLPVLHALNLSLRLAAIKADRALAAKGEKESKQQEAARVLQRAFQYTITDRSALPSSKKWGSLGVINTLFKIYFSINNLRLCQNLIRAVEGPAFPKALDGQVVEGRKFAVADLVTYKYFVGRLSLLNSQFARAERELAYAFDHCPKRSFKNKRLVLRYLVPVRMALGVFAASRLLKKYNLEYWAPICKAVHKGDIAAFEGELSQHQQLFIRHGSYLLVERSKMIAYRNFFRRVHDLQREKTTRLDIKVFKRCLNKVGVEMDTDEIECVLANLIYSGYIKGYISHQHGKLVVSKGTAFPPLRDIFAES